MRAGAVGERRVDRQHVVAGNAKAERARAAGIVAGHAAKRRAGRRRNVHREPQTMRLERAIEIIEHDARLDRAAAPRDIEIEDAVQIFRAVDDQRMVDRLPALRSAAAARQYGHPLLAGERDGALRLRNRARRDDTDWHDLVMRGVSRIAPAREGIEPYIAGDIGPQPALEPRHLRHFHLLNSRLRLARCRTDLTDCCIRP